MTNFILKADFYINWRYTLIMSKMGFSIFVLSILLHISHMRLIFIWIFTLANSYCAQSVNDELIILNLRKKYSCWKMSSYRRLSNVMTTGIDSKVKNSQALDVLLFAFWNSQKLDCRKCFVWNFWYNQSKISKWKDDLLPLYEQTCHHSVVYLFRNHNAFVISASG